MNGNRGPSLRRHLITRLAYPLLTLMLIDAGFSYYFALQFANSAYDYWLLDSARSLAAQVKSVDGRASLNLPKEALEVFEFDVRDRVVYQVAYESGALILGQRGLLITKPAQGAREPSFFETTFEREPVRGVALRATPAGVSEPITIAVAETLHKRQGLAAEILIIVLVPQLLLILSAAMLIWSGVTVGLRSLTQVSNELENKGHRDLTAIPTTGIPEEIRPIIAKVNELFGRLNTALFAQRKFIADAAHQLRTPLAAVKLQAENLERQPAPQAVRDQLGALKRATDRAAHLTQQLLTLARAEPEFNPERHFIDIDLVQVVRDAGERMIPEALNVGVELVLVAPDTPVMIKGDPTLVSELVSNLVDNALRYGLGTETVQLQIDCEPEPCITVEDHGAGIASDEIHRVSERFYRSATQTTEGTGLGLAIVKEIAESHGGSISLESRPQFPGLRVRVAFPLPRDSNASGVAPASG